ncbi:MAG TPA: hypothetical protein VGD89_13945 [Flavipsychrobacter sp.]
MITEKFSTREQRKLRNRLAMYGTIAHCARQTGIHRSTITRVLTTGIATAPVVQKLRLYISDKSRVFVEAA